MGFDLLNGVFCFFEFLRLFVFFLGIGGIDVVGL